MSASGAVEFDWGDGHYRFKLGLEQLCELQEKCGAGPEAIRTRLAAGFPNALDMFEILRLGLVGGGLESGKAHSLASTYVAGRPRAHNYTPALAVLTAAIVGPPEDPAGKPLVEEAGSPVPAEATAG